VVAFQIILKGLTKKTEVQTILNFYLGYTECSNNTWVLVKSGCIPNNTQFVTSNNSVQRETHLVD